MGSCAGEEKNENVRLLKLMKLLYMWIEQFRNISGQGFIIDNEYNVSIDCSDKVTFHYYSNDGNRILFSGDAPQFGRKVYERALTIELNEQYAERQSTDPIDSVAVLVGDNATGKSSILECLCARCDQSNYDNKDAAYYFFVFYDKANHSVIVRTKSEVQWV